MSCILTCALRLAKEIQSSAEVSLQNVRFWKGGKQKSLLLSLCHCGSCHESSSAYEDVDNKALKVSFLTSRTRRVASYFQLFVKQR